MLKLAICGTFPPALRADGDQPPPAKARVPCRKPEDGGEPHATQDVGRRVPIGQMSQYSGQPIPDRTGTPGRSGPSDRRIFKSEHALRSERGQNAARTRPECHRVKAAQGMTHRVRPSKDHRMTHQTRHHDARAPKSVGPLHLLPLLFAEILRGTGQRPARHPATVLESFTRRMGNLPMLPAPWADRPSYLNLRSGRFQHPALDLILFDAFEQRAEIALTEAVIALALDEFKEDRPDHRTREDL